MLFVQGQEQSRGTVQLATDLRGSYYSIPRNEVMRSTVNGDTRHRHSPMGEL